jgi:predicted phosphodiesterase
LQRRGTALAPRKGETLVLAEADPQGSFVGVHVRKAFYTQLADLLGPDAISLRTISGDVTSNGTVAESAYVKAESRVSKDIPVVAVGGDHDSEKTWRQMKSDGITVPDFATVDVDGLEVSGANDREHKTLFGGSITNPEGVSEQELGTKLRDKVGDRTGIVLMHQPDALVGYLGIDSLATLHAHGVTASSRTTPYDDGIPDQPPGIVDVGHLHQPDGPWVLWNTDGPTVTWTVVDQLGTAGGVENAPTFSRFSTPVSAPLKPIMVRLQYVNVESGLQTGYVTVECALDATCTISDRVDVGLPSGKPGGLLGGVTTTKR